MLQTIREKAQGVFAWIIVILISVPFALWGIQEYLGVGGAAVKASVNGYEISEQEFENSYRRFREEMRLRLGEDYSPELVDDKLLRKEVLESTINSELIHQLAIGLGIRTSDEVLIQINKTNPAFQINGRFSQDAYENALRRQGLSEEGYVHQMRRLMASEQLVRAVSGSEIVTHAELKESLRLADQKRKADYIIVPAKNFESKVEIKPDEIDAYYKENQQAFMSSERVKLEYLELNIDKIASTESISDEDLQGYYEQNKAKYVSPEGRKASHILLLLEEGADKAATDKARKAAEDALARINAGEEFSKVAKEVSQDPGSAESGGDLGFFEKGVMDPEFENAAFTMEKGAVSGLVKSQFGFHIIKLTDIRPEKGKSFEEAREEVVDAARKDSAGRKFYELAEQLGELSYEDPGSLEPAADALKLKIEKSDWIGREGGDGLLANGRVITTAFSEDVLGQGNNSELIELGAEHVVVLRVDEYEEAKQQPLEDVRDEIESILKQRAASKLAENKAKDLIKALSAGESLAKLVASGDVKLHQPETIGRVDKEVPGEILDVLFTMQKPGSGDTVLADTSLSNGDHAVIYLHEVQDGTLNKISNEDRDRIKSSLARVQGQSSFAHMVRNMRDGSEIVIPEDNEQ